MLDVLRAVGANVEWTGPESLTIDTTGPLQPEAPYELVRRMRASINVLGPLVARCGEARVALPGGDNIGSRRLDMHVRGLEAMGAEIAVEHGFIHARCNALCGARIVLEFPSVGATENLLTAAVLAKGETVIENAAREPEITDLTAFLNRMGAHVIGAGTSTITVEGVDELVAADTEIMGDRIEAGTYLMACGIAGGEVELVGVRLEHLEMVAVKLGEMGMRVSPTPDGIWAQAAEPLRAVDIATLPYPGFATDFMPMAVALLAVGEGTGIVTENVFDNRLSFVEELIRMGADVRHEGRHAVVRGRPRLSGAPGPGVRRARRRRTGAGRDAGRRRDDHRRLAPRRPRLSGPPGGPAVPRRRHRTPLRPRRLHATGVPNACRNCATDPVASPLALAEVRARTTVGQARARIASVSTPAGSVPNVMP